MFLVVFFYLEIFWISKLALCAHECIEPLNWVARFSITPIFHRRNAYPEEVWLPGGGVPAP